MEVDLNKLERAFNPKVVVVIGDRQARDFMWLRGQQNVKGKLLSVQINPESAKLIEKMGIKNYSSLLDIPDPIDLAIVCVPAAVAPQILEELIQKNVGAAHFFTAGFAETDTEEGRKLEARFVERAKQANFHLIGPNCMGIFNPKAGLRQNTEQYVGEWGPVGFISQSGNIAMDFSLEAYDQKVLINKSVSFGNGIILEAADYLEYMGNDDECKIIGMYLEGVKNGRRFLDVLKNVASRKPVVIWKGGRTEIGGRAISSHTASLAISQAIWVTAMKQCGALTVRNLEELLDTLKALIYLPPVYGDRVGVTGGSGGQSVTIADAFAEAGLDIPRLTQESYSELGTFWRNVGGGFDNPIDTGNENRFQMKRILEVLEKDKNVDNIVMVMGLTLPGWGGLEFREKIVDMLIELKQRSPKPVLMIVPSETKAGRQRGDEIIPRSLNGGVPVFGSYDRAARALKHVQRYYEYKNRK